MVEKIKFNDVEYDYDNLSEEAKACVAHIKIVEDLILEANNMHAVLSRAKISYVESIKREILSKKSGFLLEES